MRAQDIRLTTGLRRPQLPSPGARGVFWRLPRVLEETALSRSTIRRMELAGEFPRRVRLSGNCVGWWSAQVENWKLSRASVDSS